MPTSSADTRYRRTEARATLNAIEAFDNTLTDTERVILHVAQTILAREPVVTPDPNSALTSDQRAALFAAFTEVFGHSEQETRHAFTAMVLGRSNRCSWASHGGLTYADASKVLDALDVLNT